MKYDIINEKDAPAAPAKATKSQAEALSIVGQLKKGSVARVEPDEGQTIRGLRANLTRAAKSAGTKIQTWDVDQVLYVKLAS
jgi:hypothetical protein